MGGQEPPKAKKHICAGLLAHVDAGKTTLSESILYLCGNIRKLGRVDHGDAFFDTNRLERSRGITIFSKQAVIEVGDKKITLLDTPGHVDFSAEMERTLQILDYGVLVINGADGVQGHTRTLWNLLERYDIPVFLFINKMDQEGTDRDKLLSQLKVKLSESCVDFSLQAVEDDLREGYCPASEEFYEAVSMCDDDALEEYLENGILKRETIQKLAAQRKVFPCFFGSALKVQGVKEFLEGLDIYMDVRSKDDEGKEEFGAKVYKISRDAQGNRLTHMKVTSGCLRVKDIVTGGKPDERWAEKVNQIRLYSGDKYEMVKEADAGTVCIAAGLAHTYAGEGLGIEKSSEPPILEPVLNYRIELPEGCDAHAMLLNLRRLEEEDPMLRIVWNEELQEINVRLMGEVQIEVLRSVIEERFGINVTFDTGNIVYKETISKASEGVGHFEPLRHYAEVHLLLEPGEPGSGMVITSDCSEDMLDRNWQRLILTHLMEKQHRGVLTGSAVTDMKITLTAGRAHLKHTEGGDFRQAAYRAVRQGLMQAGSVLLEPYYDFRLEVPTENVGRSLADIQKRNGEFDPPETEGELSIIVGNAPASCMRDYQAEVIGYTKGRGQFTCTFKGYFPCHNAEEVIQEIGYEAEHDTSNPSGSVFCSHGAGFNVPWNKVFQYMHIESQMERRRKQEAEGVKSESVPMKKEKVSAAWNEQEEKELEEIFIRTYGKIERRPDRSTKTIQGDPKEKNNKRKEQLKEYLLVDGYNIIFAWEELKELAKVNIEAARNKLMDILCNYQGFKKCVVILVFDAYKVEGYALEIQKYHNIHVVYTKEAETADQYIEKVVHEIGRKYHVTVATSDGVEQVVTLGQGGTLISAREFQEEIEITRRQIREEYEKKKERGKNYLFDHMDEELAEEMEEVRLGRKEIK